jgi:hypothetical protein
MPNAPIVRTVLKSVFHGFNSSMPVKLLELASCLRYSGTPTAAIGRVQWWYNVTATLLLKQFSTAFK